MRLTRRSFLGTSAAVIAGTMAKGATLGANERVRICVAGVNGRGKNHIEGFGAIADSGAGTAGDPYVLNTGPPLKRLRPRRRK